MKRKPFIARMFEAIAAGKLSPCMALRLLRLASRSR